MSTSRTFLRWRRALRRISRRYLVYPLQAAAVFAIYGVFRVLPLDTASNAGGRLLRTLGPRLGAAKRAERHLSLAFPDKAPEEIRRIARDMWENLGRVLAEYAHLDRLLRQAQAEGMTPEPWQPKRIELVGADALIERRRRGEPTILATAHVGNWEISPITATLMGVQLTTFYRPPNNPYIDRLILGLRTGLGNQFLQKSMAGGGSRRALSVLRAGGTLAMLVDQRFSGGVHVPFFGRAALTSPAAVELAMHFKCPVVPVRVVRLNGARFRVIVEPALDIPSTGDRKADVREGTARLTAVVERWVREHPAQWLWLHKRWRG